MNVTISPNPPSIHAGQNVVFTATPDTAVDSASYTWTFQGTPTTGGATYDTGALAAGTYTVSVQMSYTLGGLPGPDQPAATVTFTVTPNNAPTVKITGAPQTANVGSTYTLTAAATDPDGDKPTHQWSDTGGGTFGAQEATTTWTPTKAGLHTIMVDVDDGFGGHNSASVPINVANRQPTAAFTVSGTGPTRTLSSTSADPDGDALTETWSVDGGATLSATTGTNVTATFPGPGAYTVRLSVSDGALSGSAAETVVIGDRSPTVTLTIAPSPAAVGAPVRITANAGDPDGGALKYAWEVGGRTYTDAVIPQQVFDKPGTYKVKVTVTDPQGASASDADTLVVSGKRGLTLLQPFPIVRIRGRIIGATTIFDVVSVKAPKGAKVRARCRGAGCPSGWSTASVKKRTWLRVKMLERRLRAGATLEIFVTKRSRIGKYTKFVVRRGRAPARTDRCVRGNRLRVMRCPAG